MQLIYTEKELPQRSQEWLEIRQSKIGGSEIPTILGLNEKYEKAHTVWKRKTGRLKPKESTAPMLRGALMEPEAMAEIRKYFKSQGFKDQQIEQYFVIHPEHEFVAVSFDGVDLTHNHIIEIKCPSTAWNFKKVVEDGVPQHYYPQVQWQLGVANAVWGIDKAWFCSYYPEGVYVVDFINYKENKEILSVHEISYDENYFTSMVKVGKLFQEFVANDVWEEDRYRAAVEEFNGNITNKHS